MDRELAASIAIIMAGLLIAGYTTLTTLPTRTSAEKSKGLLIVVTFPNLVYDVKQLVCESDQVVSLVPPGVDPHTYTLSLADVEKAEKADIVISTGHAPFEIRLREYISPEKLIEIPRIPGIRIENIIGTSSPNLHMPIYDPHNYIVFIKFVAERLAKLRPQCKQHYLTSARIVENKVAEIIESSPRLEVSGVGSTPLTQYAVGWLGIRLRALMLVSPEAGITAQSYERLKTLMASHSISVAVVTSLSMNGCKPAGKADEKVLTLANTYHVPVICVPAPFTAAPIPDKLEHIALQAKKLYPLIVGG